MRANVAELGFINYGLRIGAGSRRDISVECDGHVGQRQYTGRVEPGNMAIIRRRSGNSLFDRRRDRCLFGHSGGASNVSHSLRLRPDRYPIILSSTPMIFTIGVDGRCVCLSLIRIVRFDVRTGQWLMAYNTTSMPTA